MDEIVPNPRCCHCLPLLISLKICSLLLALIYLTMALIFAFFGFNSIGLFPFAVTAFILFVFAFLFFKGLQIENEFYMIPFLVSEILVRVICGFVLCFLWGTFVLASFDMIIVNCPVKNITAPQFFFLTALFATAVYGIFVRIFFFFYRGYSVVKKTNDHRRRCANESQYMKISFTSRPTSL
uniref:MARVEL domain-containing protein n=1 Tax=Panagrolaimus sp. JU765 TaxID=591449 RepID=A0AC34R904_9BILA